MTREEWLSKATDALSVLFKQIGVWKQVPIQVSCGWPCRKATARKNRRIGECHPSSGSTEKRREIFVSPVTSDSVAVLEILTHELIHALDDCKSGHKGFFKDTARAIGLEGKLTSTHAGTALKGKLQAIADTLGVYPHAVLDTRSTIKKDGTRLLKATCGECGYTIRVTRIWADLGLPTCHCGGQIELA